MTEFEYASCACCARRIRRRRGDLWFWHVDPNGAITRYCASSQPETRAIRSRRRRRRSRGVVGELMTTDLRIAVRLLWRWLKRRSVENVSEIR